MHKLVTMRVLLFIIIVFVIGWFISPESITGATGMAQTTPKDSIIAPNVFTPNGDGRNDIFEVRSMNGNVVLLKIYTRAGALVFSIEAERCRWDGCTLSGRPLASGIYYWTAETTEIYDSSPKTSRADFVYLFR